MEMFLQETDSLPLLVGVRRVKKIYKMCYNLFVKPKVPLILEKWKCILYKCLFFFNHGGYSTKYMYDSPAGLERNSIKTGIDRNPACSHRVLNVFTKHFQNLCL